MQYVELPEYFPCSFRGINSPVILRAEAGCEHGGMVVEEFRYSVPHVHLYGETTAAREQFHSALLSLRDYVDSLERHDLVRSDHPFVSPTWFNIELRQPDYRATLWGDRDMYDFSWVCSEGLLASPAAPNFSLVRQDFRDAFERLKLIYEKLFNTTF